MAAADAGAVRRVRRNTQRRRMHIREAQVTDAPAIAQVHIDTWRTTYKGLVPDAYLASLSYEQRTSFWQSRLSESNSPWFVYVAEDNDQHVIGFASGGPERTQDTVYTGELVAIYLLAAHQRQGVGRQLTAAIAQRLIQQGHRSMLVWVLAANPSRLFYASLGGQLIRERAINLDGIDLAEVAYGWRDLHALANTLLSAPAL